MFNGPEGGPKLAELHTDVSAMKIQIEGNKTPNKAGIPTFANRSHKLGSVFPIDAYGAGSSYGNKVLFTDLPALSEAPVVMAVLNIYCDPEGDFNTLYPRHLEYYRLITGMRQDIVTRVTTAKDLADVIQNAQRTAVLQSVEGIYGSNPGLAVIDQMWNDGIRSIVPIHNKDNEIGTGHPTKGEPGLTAYGRDFIRLGAQRGFIFDHSHIHPVTSVQIIQEVDKVTDRPTIISHTGSRAKVPHMTRATDDNIAIAVAQKGGLIGVMPAKWLHSADEPSVTVETVVDTIEHYLNLFERSGISNSHERLGIGTDGDGMGTESTIPGIDNIVLLGPALDAEMQRRQWAAEVREAILYKSAVNFYLKWLPL